MTRDQYILEYCGGEVPTLDQVRHHLANHQGVPALKPLGKACHDCAIACDFYTPLAAMASLLPLEEQDEIVSRWFCHNHPDRGCRGVRDWLDSQNKLKN